MTRQDQAQAPPAGHHDHGRGRPPAGCHGRTRTQSPATGPAVATAAAGRPGRKLETSSVASVVSGGIRVGLSDPSRGRSVTRIIPWLLSHWHAAESRNASAGVRVRPGLRRTAAGGDMPSLRPPPRCGGGGCRRPRRLGKCSLAA
jgi:hypothetical protein